MNPVGSEQELRAKVRELAPEMLEDLYDRFVVRWVELGARPHEVPFSSFQKAKACYCMLSKIRASRELWAEKEGFPPLRLLPPSPSLPGTEAGRKEVAP